MPRITPFLEVAAANGLATICQMQKGFLAKPKGRCYGQDSKAEGSLIGTYWLVHVHENIDQVPSGNKCVLVCSPKGLQGVQQALLQRRAFLNHSHTLKS